jgi:hypothetical protein
VLFYHSLVAWFCGQIQLIRVPFRLPGILMHIATRKLHYIGALVGLQGGAAQSFAIYPDAELVGVVPRRPLGRGGRAARRQGQIDY